MSFADDRSGVDSATARLVLDGVDRTVDCSVTATFIVLNPSEPPELLAEGGHAVTVTVRDVAGNQGQATVLFTVDATPPALVFLSPEPSLLSANPEVAIDIELVDGTSGADPASFALTLDGSAVAGCSVTSTAAFCTSPPLTTGEHRLEASVSDRAGNVASAEHTFTLLLDREPPLVTVETPQDGAIVRAPAVHIAGTAEDDLGLAALRVDGREVQLVAGRFEADVILGEGLNLLLIEAQDVFGRSTLVDLHVTLDTDPPTLTLDAPRPGQPINAASARVTGEATDEHGDVRVEVNGQAVPLDQGRFETALVLTEGENPLQVRAFDQAGNSAEVGFVVVRFTLPEIAITSPADLSYLVETTTTVTGTVSDPAAAVAVNGMPAALSGTSFSAAGVPLIEGGNVLTATATTANGRVGTDSINVVRDTTPPRLAVRYPQDGATLFAPAVTVSGLVNDIVPGTVNASEATVLVNDRPAAVANRSFMAAGVPLAPGENLLTVVAIDESGNRGEATVTVRRAEPAAPRLAVVSGDGQTATIGAALPDPLVVQLLDGQGLAVPGRPVIFKIRGGNGSLDGGRRQIAVVTDAGGRAAAHLTLGTRAGAASQAVEASAIGFAGPAVFTATAEPSAPALLVVDAGNHQVGIAGRALPRPLVAVVVDSGFNRLEGYPIALAVTRGQGHFEDGSRELLAASDSDGRVVVPFVLDPEEGISNNVVEARLAGFEGSPVATFVASGRGAGEPSATTISGIVLDNSDQPVPGVTLRIKEQPTLTAESGPQGIFRLAGAPVGTLHLIVDGSTADRPGPWPDLEFLLTTIPGRDNTVGMPIYLLPLDLQHGLMVDETRGGTITLPEVPGFALEIAPGSVSFPGGGKSGVVSVTAVHSDKIPMVPNFGQQPRFIVTIQPAGALFDPPARLVLPNLEGLAPGEVTELYSFDHDLGHFVSIGPATVTENGKLIASNQGVGILKAGWHCGGNPPAPGTPHGCPQCQLCDGSKCVPGCSLQGLSGSGAEMSAVVAAACPDCDDRIFCTVNDTCTPNGGCRGKQVEVDEIIGPCVAAVDAPVTFVADSNGPDRLNWAATPEDAASPQRGTGGAFTTRFSRETGAVVTVGCLTTQLREKQLSVLRSCQSITPELINFGKETPPPFFAKGFTSPGFDPTYNALPCASSEQRCFRLEFLRIGYTTGVASHGATDITGAEDSDVTEETCSAIIADLTPRGPDDDPPLRQYWASDIMQLHEAVHIGQIVNNVHPEIMVEFAAAVSDAKNCSGECPPATPPAGSFDRLLDEIRLRIARQFEEDPETEAAAHRVSNPRYEERTRAIRERAVNEGWVQCF
ncbi:MAG: hypothetical protein ACRELA_17195 [Candidatus Rokuibacteriota bacterium]